MFVCLEPAAKYKLVLRQVLLLLCQQPFWGSGGWVDQGASWQPQEKCQSLSIYCLVLQGIVWYGIVAFSTSWYFIV